MTRGELADWAKGYRGGHTPGDVGNVFVEAPGRQTLAKDQAGVAEGYARLKMPNGHPFEVPLEWVEFTDNHPNAVDGRQRK